MFFGLPVRKHRAEIHGSGATRKKASFLRKGVLVQKRQNLVDQVMGDVAAADDKYPRAMKLDS
jgi:hypothetical protein